MHGDPTAAIEIVGAGETKLLSDSGGSPKWVFGQTVLPDLTHDESTLQEFTMGMNALYRAIERAAESDIELVTRLVNTGHDEDGFRVKEVRTHLRVSCSPFWRALILLANKAGTEAQQVVRRQMLLVLAGVYATTTKKQTIGLWSEGGMYFQSPLHYVIRLPNAGLIAFLIDNICEPNVLDGVGRTAIFYARTIEIGGQLVHRGVCPLEWSVANRCLELHPEKVPVGLTRDSRGWVVTGPQGVGSEPDEDDRIGNGDTVESTGEDTDCSCTIL